MRKLFSILSSTLQEGLRGGLLFLALMATTCLLAEDFSVNGIYYNYLDGNNVEVTYRGNNAENYKNSYSGEVTIPASITYNGATYSVTSIGEYAFVWCSSLTSIIIPNSVTSIGFSAFGCCSSLTSIEVDANNSNYSSVDGVLFNKDRTTLIQYPEGKQGAYIIPNSVTSIGVLAFRNCSSLTSVTIPNSVTSIGEYAFVWCSSLTSITIPNSVTSIGYDTFSDCSSLTSVILTASSEEEFCIGQGNQLLHSIGVSCKRKIQINDTEVTEFTIPNSVTTIGKESFSGCSSLTSITIPNSVTSIGERAFSACSSLTSIEVDANNSNYSSVDGVLFNKDRTTLIQYPEGKQGAYIIPNSVTSIGYRAFFGCSSLTSVTIGKSVISIGIYAFHYCSKLTSVTINSDAIVNKSYLSYSNISHIFGSQVTKYIIGDKVKGIGEMAFSGCSSLTSVTIGKSVTSIGESTFEGCSSLKSITIPNSVTSIGEYAFVWCSSLTSIIIPNSVTSIGFSAFGCCSSLTSIEVDANNSNYSSVDGVLFNKDRTTLIQYPEGKQGQGAYIIPNSVTSIGYRAFFGCSFLTSVTIGKSVTSIGEYAFQNCSSLTSVTIGNSVTSIGNRAFDGCNDITSVTWNAKNCNAYNFGSQVTSFEFGNEVEVVPNSLCKGMEKLTSITTPNSLKTIGTSAFEGCVRLGKISLGTGLEEIAANAFAGCTRLYDIYTYATYPPFAEESSFANYNVYVYVPCEYQRGYTLDVVWGKFKFIECIDSEEATTDGNVTIVPGYNDVTITWPTEDNADNYAIVIEKDGEVFCTLTFNADGQLLNIAFAPARNGDNRPVQYAEQAVNGYRFTVTGLTEATQYAYSVTTKDAANQTIATYSGEFTTMGGDETAVDNITTNNANIQKILRDGQLLILRGGVEYNAMGQEL